MPTTEHTFSQRGRVHSQKRLVASCFHHLPHTPHVQTGEVLGRSGSTRADSPIYHPPSIHARRNTARFLVDRAKAHVFKYLTRYNTYLYNTNKTRESNVKRESKKQEPRELRQSLYPGPIVPCPAPSSFLIRPLHVQLAISHEDSQSYLLRHQKVRQEHVFLITQRERDENQGSSVGFECFKANGTGAEASRSRSERRHEDRKGQPVPTVVVAYSRDRNITLPRLVCCCPCWGKTRTPSDYRCDRA